MSNLTENHWSCNIVTVSVHVTSMPSKSAFHLFIYISASCAVVEKGTGVSWSTIGTTYCFYQVFVSALLTAKPFYLAPNGLFCTKTGFSFQITFHQVSWKMSNNRRFSCRLLISLWSGRRSVWNSSPAPRKLFAAKTIKFCAATARCRLDTRLRFHWGAEFKKSKSRSDLGSKRRKWRKSAPNLIHFLLDSSPC